MLRSYAMLRAVLAPLGGLPGLCLARAPGLLYPNKLGVNTSFHNSTTTALIAILRLAMESGGSFYLLPNSTGSADYAVLRATLPHLRLYMACALGPIQPHLTGATWG